MRQVTFRIPKVLDRCMSSRVRNFRTQTNYINYLILQDCKNSEYKKNFIDAKETDKAEFEECEKIYKEKK